MKTLYLAALAALVSIISTDRAGAQSNSYDRAFFENRSSERLYLYKPPMSTSSRAVRRIEPGEIVSVPSRNGDLWIVSTPVWYRPVSSLQVSGRYGRRLVVRDSDLRAIGTKDRITGFANRSGRDVMVRAVIAGKERDWVSIKRGRTILKTSFAGQDWVIREQSSGRFIQRSTTPDRRSTITIEPPRTGGGHGHGGAPHDLVVLTITNTTPNEVALYKKTRFGSRLAGTIAPRRSTRFEAEPGETWRVEDPESGRVLRTIIVPDDDPHCDISIGYPPTRPTPPPAPRQVKIEFHNHTSGTINIYKIKDGRWKYTKRISPGRDYRLEFDTGQPISVRDARTNRELEALRAPSRDMILHVRPPADQGHGHGRQPASRQDPDEAFEPERRRPGDLLRRILGGG